MAASRYIGRIKLSPFLATWR